MSYREVMDMPIRAFWSFNAQIDRLRAEENLDLLDLFVIANANAGGEMYTTLRERLHAKLGEPAVYDESQNVVTETDPEAWREGTSKLLSLLS